MTLNPIETFKTSIYSQTTLQNMKIHSILFNIFKNQYCSNK